MVPEGGFRCPFEVRGEKEGTIIEVELGEDKGKRVADMSEGFERFHNTPKSPGIKFILPEYAWRDCKSNLELKPIILPYQTEMLAAEMDYRLRPFLPYQMTKVDQEEAMGIFQKTPYKLLAASELINIMNKFGVNPDGPTDTAAWLEKIMKEHMEKGVKNPMFKIFGTYDQQISAVEVMEISVGGIVLPSDREEGQNNQNCFSLVKTPFYPKEFGRYSTNVELVMSREIDFKSLPMDKRRKIRHDSNSVLQKHGIEIIDLENDRQGGGLWIPEEK
jgi:hypothetical protein